MAENKQKIIWELRSSDGIRRYYWDKGEADFACKDSQECGFACRMQTIAVPQTPKEFAQFMSDQFADYRELIVAAKRAAAA
jgi:ubiquinone biosynthesis protein COQ9